MPETISLTCPVCGGRVKVTSGQGVTCCFDCGYVFNLSKLDGRTFPKFERAERSGNAKYMPRIFINKSSRREIRVIRVVEEMSELLGVNWGIKREAVNLCVKAAKRVKGRVDPYVLAGLSIISASRKLGQPRSLSEVIRLLKELGKRRRIKDFMKMTKMLGDCRIPVCSREPSLESYIDSVISAVFNHHEVLSRFNGNLKVGEVKKELRQRALKLLHKLPKSWINGKRPYVIASALLYLAELERAYFKGGKLFSQRILAECTFQSEYTIRERVIDLYRLGVSFLDRTRRPVYEKRYSLRNDI